ncbi:FIG00554585: hypothetical protein [Cronobacter malonaticus 681]|nr:FIG00554585: hypothetical protein [Cronobacter malonaticus 681]
MSYSSLESSSPSSVIRPCLICVPPMSKPINLRMVFPSVTNRVMPLSMAYLRKRNVKEGNPPLFLVNTAHDVIVVK